MNLVASSALLVPFALARKQEIQLSLKRLTRQHRDSPTAMNKKIAAANDNNIEQHI
jgi:hypothetical protein